jgi:tripartite-type tricarboxylate transporter receptor subunit TctC
MQNFCRTPGEDQPTPDDPRRLILAAKRGGNMAAQEWTVRQLMEALKKYPPDAKVFYEMGPNGAGTIGKAQYVKARGEDDQLGVLLDR